MGTIIGNLLRGFAKFIRGLKPGIRKMLPISIEIVNAIKALSENVVVDNIFEFVLEFVKARIPGERDNKIIDKVNVEIHRLLPLLLLNLQIIKEIDNTLDPEQRAKKLTDSLQQAILNLRFSTEEQKQMFWRGFSQQFIVALSDGKITWSEIGGLAEYIWLEQEKI